MWSSLLSHFVGLLKDRCHRSCSEHVCYNSRDSVLSKMTESRHQCLLFEGQLPTLQNIPSPARKHLDCFAHLFICSCSRALGIAGDAVRKAADTCSWRCRNLFSHELSLGRACISADTPQQTSTLRLRDVIGRETVRVVDMYRNGYKIALLLLSLFP